MSDLSLKQLQDLGVNNFMSDKEIEKTLTKALEEQQTSLNAEKVTKEQTLEDGDWVSSENIVFPQGN